MASLLVIIPALNESATIQTVIRDIPMDINGVSKIEVLVIDDGSNDNTAELARLAGARVVVHPNNLGVGAALQAGLDFAVENEVDIAVNIDGDGQFNSADIPKLAQPIVMNEADFVSASRFKDPALTPKMPLIKCWGNFAISYIISLLTRNRFHDVSCGFRAYSREALLRLILRGEFTYTQEMFLILSFKRMRILEIPLAVHGEREHGKSRVTSSIVRYAIRTSAIIYRCFRDYKPSILFNGVALGLFIIAVLLGIFFVGHRIVAGRFTPHIWSGFLSGFLFTIAFVVFLFGQIASMLDRNRFYQEEIIYHLRKKKE
jgi:glycosyltransferase involved in cell wall biosynthesis